MRSLPIVLSLTLLPVLAGAESLWVSQRGSDTHPGTKDQPFATLKHALAKLQPGSTLHVLPGDQPWSNNIRITVNGTVDAPLTIDGHGSIVSGRRELPAAAWTTEGNDIYSRKLPNNAWGMEMHWEGGFPLVWFAGQPGRNVASCEGLSPGSYFLHKNRKKQKTDPLHNTLYICLKPGQTPANARIESIIGEGGIYVGGNHVIVRDFVTEYGGRDGFATHRNQGVVFEDIEARHFMDQGMSHHGANVTIRRAHFHHNAGGGVVDVYPECKTRYENCLIELDTWRGGVEFHNGEYEMINCLIRANIKKALTVTKGARVTLSNCVLIGTADGTSEGITLGSGSSLTLRRCTLINFRTGLTGSINHATRANLEDCQFLKCANLLRLNTRQDRGQAAPDLPRQFTTDQVAADVGRIEITSRVQTEDDKWQVKSQRHRLGEAGFPALRTLSGDVDLRARHGTAWPFDSLPESVR